jgi:hypothetical protein
VVSGGAYLFNGDERIELLTGNGAALQVFLNRQDLGLLGLFGEVVGAPYLMVCKRLRPYPPPAPCPITPTAAASGEAANWHWSGRYLPEHPQRPAIYTAPSKLMLHHPPGNREHLNPLIWTGATLSLQKAPRTGDWLRADKIHSDGSTRCLHCGCARLAAARREKLIETWYPTRRPT